LNVLNSKEMVMSQESKRTDLVTGAFSYTGRYLAGRLLASGINVRTLTGHPARSEAAKSPIDTRPYEFDDPAALAASFENVHTFYNTVDAVGPEVYTFLELVTLIRSEVGSRAPIVHVPAQIGCVLGRVLGLLLGDVLLTREEIAGLTANLLVSTASARCKTSFRAWLQENRKRLGASYLSELALHYD
jgi:NAD(P)-dependent dehydrogenase (short-subunit alcohol dehydrogenase family)